MNIVYEYLKTKIFSRATNIPKCIGHQIFLDTQLQPLGISWIWLNYPIFNFKKRLCPKNVWIQHWLIQLWRIHTRGQYLHCDLKKVFIKIRHFEMLMYGATLGSPLIFPLAFLHKSDTWSVSFKFSFIFIVLFLACLMTFSGR